jgi:hypothetical protein
MLYHFSPISSAQIKGKGTIYSRLAAPGVAGVAAPRVATPCATVFPVRPRTGCKPFVCRWLGLIAWSLVFLVLCYFVLFATLLRGCWRARRYGLAVAINVKHGRGKALRPGLTPCTAREGLYASTIHLSIAMLNRDWIFEKTCTAAVKSCLEAE